MSAASRERWYQQQQGEPNLREAEFRLVLSNCIARGKSMQHAEYLNIGPIEAAVLLEYSRGNVRRESMQHVAAIARDIAAGRWVATNQGFGIDVEGVFYDGHHRAKAIIESGATVRVQISFGAPTQAIHVVDDIKRRSIADRLRQSKKLVATVRALLRVKQQFRGATVYTADEVHQAFEANLVALETLQPFIGHAHPASFWGAALFAFPVAPELVADIAKDVAYGATPGTQAFTLREFLLRAPTAGNINSDKIGSNALYTFRNAILQRPMSRMSAHDDDTVFRWFFEQRAKVGAP